ARTQPAERGRVGRRTQRETRYLLDTHFIYWWMTGDRRLGKAARTLIATTDCTVSVASLWEMLMRSSIRPLGVTGLVRLPWRAMGSNLS
ncbi:MAG: type II toxin-antitoxin system VapC family toxin, partial [Gammaproteobacteria bacterium]